MAHERRGKPKHLQLHTNQPLVGVPKYFSTEAQACPLAPLGTHRIFVFESACPFDPHKGCVIHTGRDYSVCLKDMKIESQRGSVTCPRSLCAELSLGSRAPDISPLLLPFLQHNLNKRKLHRGLEEAKPLNCVTGERKHTDFE